MEQPIEPEFDPSAEQKNGPLEHVLELPLFPLDLVLFPHMLVPLHIFEDRYKEMINRCVHESLPFGIVLTIGANPATGRVDTSEIGCTARIARVERLPDGRMNIEVVGENRFRILDTHESLPYRMGLIEPLADDPADAATVVPLADDVHKLLKDFLTRSLAMMGQSVGEFDLPDEPEQLSFTAACVLPIDNEEKQSLLEDTDTVARLTWEKDILMREVTRLRRAAETSEVEQAETETSVAEMVWRPVKSDRYSAYLSVN